MDTKLEVVVSPVSDVELAKEFCQRLRWRLDVTPPGVVQLTPHGSGCSVQFGANLTQAAPGSGKGYLIVPDIPAARDALVEAGVELGEMLHVGPNGPVSGPDPEHRSYFSRATFSDPDRNSWLLQQITTRLPGRVEPGATSFGSASDLASALTTFLYRPRSAREAHRGRSELARLVRRVHGGRAGGDSPPDVSDYLPTPRGEPAWSPWPVCRS